MKHDMTLERTIELERFDSTGASGFVNRQDGDESVVVRLVSGKEILGETRAELFRPDLVARNVSAHPYCGFVLPVPLEKVKSSFGKIDVVRADGILIARGDAEQKSAINLQGIGAEEILTLCGDIFCGVNHFAIEVGVLSVWGLVLPPRGRYGDLECVGQDGVSFKFHWPIHSPGSEDFYWYFPGAPYLGFRIDIDLARSADPSPFFEFYFRIKGEDEARAKLRNVSVSKDFRSFQNYPGDYSVKRVQNLSSTVEAMVAGFTDYRRVAALASRYVDLGPNTRILDWGCGFGRVCRHFLHNFPGARVTGVELDEFNLDWMSEHLPNIVPIKTGLDAKIDLPDASADVIYGISVMTHIRQSQQVAWLEELKRILAPGGVLILTTSGSGALAFGSRWLDRRCLDSWRNLGFLEFDHASKYDRDIGGGSYYIQAYQSFDNTRRRWGEIVDIVGFIPSVFGYQDVVVMR
jgi:SAM-dependent methyltransferase